MSDQSATPESQSPESEVPVDRPLSRRERRGKADPAQSSSGPARAGRFALPLNKRSNFVRGERG